MKIVVLAGGLSTERDVSLETGRQVAAALRARGHQVALLDAFLGYGDERTRISGVFDGEGRDLLMEETERISGEAPDLERVRAMRTDPGNSFFGPNVIRICQAAEMVFLALHGADGENGRVQAAFDLYGIRYTGAGYIGSALAMDKGLTKTLFSAAEIPMPRGVPVHRESSTTPEAAGLSLPCVVKPACGGSSIGVSIVSTPQEYAAALEEAFTYEDAVIVEEYIAGREFSVGVIGRTPLPVIEIAPKEGFYDYANKYNAGSTVETCPADLPEETADEMQRLALRVSDVLGLAAYSRTDFLMDANGRLYCLEANTLPGMTPTSLLPQEAAVIGLTFEDLCEKLVDISLEKYRD